MRYATIMLYTDGDQVSIVKFMTNPADTHMWHHITDLIRLCIARIILCFIHLGFYLPFSD